MPFRCGANIAFDPEPGKHRSVPTSAPFARAVVRYVVDFALPPRCPGCAAIVQEEHSFCLSCWSQLVFLGLPCCIRCGLPFEHDGAGDAECGACLADPPRFDRMRAAVAYGDIPRKVALKLKYGGRPGVAETMARLMARHLPQESGAILAPVPLHRWRIWKRGYNQAGLIASALARRSGTPAILDLLERTKPTPPLKNMTPRERSLAVRGAFRVAEKRKAALQGRTILLVDDVFTSGATANACAMALKRAGAGEVHLLCWARVIRAGEL